MRLLGLLRLGNCAMAFLGVFIGATVERSPLIIGDLTMGPVIRDLPIAHWTMLGMLVPGFELPFMASVLIAAIAAFLVTGAGNALNDYYDTKVDKKAHPERPIPSGQVTPAEALNFARALFILGLVMALLINWICMIIALVNSGLLIAYERSLKSKGLSGNMTISYLTASVFLFGGACALSFQIVPILFMLGFFVNVGREITKDIEDMEGDKGYRTTYPMVKGIRPAANLAIAFILIGVILSPLPAFIHFKNYHIAPLGIYLTLVIVADAIFIYSCGLVMEKPKKAQNTMKVAMLMALIAFFLGGLFPPPMNI